jgi:zinc protease
VHGLQLATGVSATHYTTADPGVFMVMSSMKPGVSYKKIEKDILAEIQMLTQKQVSEAELSKAKNQTMMGYISGLTTLDGKAQSLALNEILFGNFEVLFSDLEKYQAVTKEEILRVSQKYLKLGSRVTAVLTPEKKKPTAKESH